MLLRVLILSVIAVSLTGCSSIHRGRSGAPTPPVPHTAANQADNRGWTIVPTDAVGVRNVVCCSSGRVLACFNETVLASDDEGNTWMESQEGLPGELMFCMAADSGGVLLIGTTRGLYRSSDEGRRWSLVNRPLIATALFASGDTLYAQEYATKAIFHSASGGQNWTPLARGWKGSLFASTVMVTSQEAIFSTLGRGLYRYNSETKTWEEMSKRAWKNWIETVAISKNGTMFAGANVSLNPDPEHPFRITTGEPPILRSTDGGNTWEPMNDLPSTCRVVHCIAFGPADEVVAGTLDGVYVSRDNGLTWERVGPVDESGRHYPILHLCVSREGRIYAVSPNHILSGEL